MPFEFKPLSLPGAVLIEPRAFLDERGLLFESYKKSEFAQNGISDSLVQENHSVSRKNTIRGLHFQRPPHGQAKLIRVVQGEIFDVGLDLRPDVPTFGKWIGVHLSAGNRKMLYLPSWCAHGFRVLSDTAEVVYKVTAEYNKEAEDGVAWNDPELGIDWGITDPLLSERDQQWRTLRDLPRLYDSWQSAAGNT